MTWSTEAIQVDAVPNQWIVTSPFTGEFFQLDHQISNLASTYFFGTLAQAEVSVDGKLYIYDPIRLKPSTDNRVFYFPKPACFSNRRLAFRADVPPLLTPGQVWNWSIAITEFISESTPTPTPTPTPTDSNFDKVLLLLHFDGSDGSQTFTDVKNNIVIASGGVALTTSDKKLGSASASFDGGYLRVNGKQFNFPGDFTFEAWVKLPSFGMVLFAVGTYEGYGRRNFSLSNEGRLQMEQHGIGQISDFGQLSLNKWQHVALSRNDGITSIFIDGIKSGSVPDKNAFGSGDTFVIGHPDSRYGFKGNMDEFRLTQQLGRYITDFALSNSPSPDN